MDGDRGTAPPLRVTADVRRERRPPEVLDLPAPRAVRLVARWLVGQGEQAHRRLRDAGDEEALHDFRVALRRLRSWLRAWRAELRGTKPRRTGREISELADLTNAARDRAVQRELLAALADKLAPAERAGARLLASHLASAGDADATLLEDIDAWWPELRPRLLQSWAVYDARMRVDGLSADRRMSEAIADEIERHARALADALAQVETSLEAAHAARIAGKRLRYLLEPIAAQERSVDDILGRMRDLQDAIGKVTDLALLERTAREVREALDHGAEAVVNGGEPPATDIVPSGASRRGRSRDPRPGLDAIVARTGRRIRRRLERLASERDDRTYAPLFDALDDLAARLRERAAANVEIERKYLLRSLPSAVAGAEVVEMAQGYVPGRKLVERLRRVRSAEGEKWFRTVKLGSGMARHEYEEETTRAVFEAMWPLTAGRRVTKRRYYVREDAAGRVWEIDDFTDRVLVLAEIELRDENEEVVVPDWLAPHLVREVTGEGTYQNSRLAK